MSEEKNEDVPIILVVEDDFDIGIIYRHFFRSKGLKVELARNGKEGLEKLATIKVDLILTDIDMPEMNGNDFCRELIEKAHVEVPIIAVTGRPDNATAPFSSVMRKPFNIVELTDTVIDMLKKGDRLQ